MRISNGLLGLVLCGIAPFFFVDNAAAACGPDALGTSRVMQVDTSRFREIQGHEKSFGLRDKEVVLTFDDGPIAGKTPRILKTLKKECVKATFFYVGRMARGYPKLVRRVVNEGHTLAHHTDAHNRLPHYSSSKASAHVDRGVSALQKIAYGEASTEPRVPFFRYPYLARTKSTDKMLARKGLIAFGANIDSRDWKRSTPEAVHNRIMRLLRKARKGIILMHDIQNRTAIMLPQLLRSLKDEGYKVVHIVPKGSRVPQIERREEPIVVASIGPQDRAPENPSAEKLEIALDQVETRKEPQSKNTDRVVNVQRTGVKRSLKKPSEVATAEKSQVLKVVVGKANAVSGRKSKSALRVVAGATGYKSRSAKPKRRNKRIAKANVFKGNWKLRRSQWIIN